MSYDIESYGAMIEDRIRTDAFASALRATVGPDSIVVDIGTGAGILALLACQAGARHVYAIEPNAIILLARELARANGFEDRITFIQDVSSNVTLPVPADVIVSDLHGMLPYYEQMLPALIDARSRFLRNGGAMIPRRERVWAALVEAPKLHDSLSEPWRSGTHGLHLAGGLEHALNAVALARFKNEKALSAPVLLQTIDYQDVLSPNLEAHVTLESERDGVAHGLAVWFDSELADGIRFSNDPWREQMVYGTAFLPFLEPIQLRAEERVATRVRADLYGRAYVWAWGAEKETESNARRSEYTQSTLLQSLPPIASLLGESQ